MGLAQSLALMPGVSRSGYHDLGRPAAPIIDRDSAARFSFLLLVPTVLGAVVLKGSEGRRVRELPPGSTGPFVVGMLAAAGSGLIAISALLGYVRSTTTAIFVCLPADRGRVRAAVDHHRREEATF